jgi:hypothetical protein
MTGLPWSTLYRWVTTKRAVPAKPGGRGYHKGQRFNSRQAVGLLLAATMHQHQLARPDYIPRLLVYWQSLSDARFAEYLLGAGGPDTDDGSNATYEERLAAGIAEDKADLRRAGIMVGDGPGLEPTSQHDRCTEVFYARLRNNLEAIKAAFRQECTDPKVLALLDPLEGTLEGVENQTAVPPKTGAISAIERLRQAALRTMQRTEGK